MAQRMTQQIPLNCPYCDEPAYQKKQSNRIVLPHAVFTLRECSMGHTFYSVEEVPENQSEVEERIENYRREQRERWKRNSDARKQGLL